MQFNKFKIINYSQVKPNLLSLPAAENFALIVQNSKVYGYVTTKI